MPHATGMRLLSKTDEDLPLNRSKLSFSLAGDLTAGQEQPQYEGEATKSSYEQQINSLVNFQQGPTPHSFARAVKDEPSKNDYSHQKECDGKVISGPYRVVLQEGRIQIVIYKADENGYVADVKYEDGQFPWWE
ncbi:hypothetical protein OUZ56_020144 [Daphnia magna]|uniref:Pro-resilin n=1 Tax=Daphnia magna TaxID=35525 RepID=A0ABQ9ZDP1_9CRUS|nr:hypothetical protein OUZ56_020144 [Daphnia magna]